MHPWNLFTCEVKLTVNCFSQGALTKLKECQKLQEDDKLQVIVKLQLVDPMELFGRESKSCFQIAPSLIELFNATFNRLG